MVKQDWSAVLHAIYEEEIVFTSLSRAELENSKPIEKIAGHTGLDNRSIQNSIEYLQTVGLLEEVDEDSRTVALSKKGFQVAHEREIAERQRQNNRQQGKRQTKSNYTVAFFTFGLLAVAAFEALIQSAVGAGISAFIIIIIGLGLAIIFVYLARKMQEFGLMSEQELRTLTEDSS